MRPTTFGNASVSVASQLVGVGIATAASIVSAKWLGPSGRGTLSIATTGSVLGATLFTFGIASVISTFTARGELTVRRAVRWTATISLLAAVLTAVAALVFRQAVPANARLALAVMPFGAAAVAISVSQASSAMGLGRLDLSAANTITTGAATLLGYIVGYSISGTGSQAVMWALSAWLLAQIAGDVVGWGLVAQASHRLEDKMQRIPWSEIKQFAFAAYPGSVVGQLNLRADIIVLGLISTLAEVGVYSIAAFIVMFVFVIPGAIGQSLTHPFGSQESLAVADLARRGVVLAWLAASVTGVAALVISWAFVPLILGHGFVRVTPMVAIMLPGLVLFSPVYVTSAYFNVAIKRPVFNTLVAGVALLADLSILSVLGREMGGIGAAVASSVAYAVSGILNVVILRRYAGVRLWQMLLPTRDDVDYLRTLAARLLRRHGNGD